MKLLVTAFAALAIVWTAAGQERAKDQAKKDPAKKRFAEFDGTWTLIKMEIGGRSILKNNEPASKLVIKDGKVLSDAKGAPQGDTELSKILDPSKKPKQITIPNFEGGDPKKGVTLIGIYELDGDELRVCVEAVETANLKQREKERPTAFDSKQGLLLVFKRVKKDEETMQGLWRVVEFETLGVKLGQDVPEVKEDRILIRGDHIVLEEKPKRELRFRIDAKQSLGAIDFAHIAGRAKDRWLPAGIYAWEGERLRLCLDYWQLEQATGRTRPAGFRTKEGDHLQVYLLERADKKNGQQPAKVEKEILKGDWIPAAEKAGAWSKPVDGLQARICFAVKGTTNGTPIITTYLELRNVSDDANPMEVPFDPPDVQFEFSVTDTAGKAVSPSKGPFRELRADQGVMRIPFDGLLRVNIAHLGAAIPKNYAAHLDLGADAAIDGITDAPAVWDFQRGDKQSYYLRAKLTVKKKNKMQWAGTLVIPKVKLPTSGE